jgi:serine/threonine-protein kinase
MTEKDATTAAMRGEDRAAETLLFESVYSDLRRVAQRHLRAGAPVAPAQQDNPPLDSDRGSAVGDVSHDPAVVARALRKIVVDHVRSRSLTEHSVAVGSAQAGDPACVALPAQADELLRFDAALQRLAALDPALAQLVELRYFGAIELAEVAERAESGGVPLRRLQRDWRRARAFLYQAPSDASTAAADPRRWADLSAFLDALFELDLAGQEASLQEREQRDPELATQARALLHADATDGLLERGLAAAAPEIIASLAADRSQAEIEPIPQAGLLIGRWRVLQPLGRGGMGEVLLAERADGEFVQLAALKRLKRGMDSDEILIRFAQERRILAALSHPNIARLLDAGVGDDGRPFFAMEYVEGETITAHAQRLGLGVRERLQLLRRVCEAVAYAQSRLVVHRDLKPSNILVDARGEPRLLDFGIAKLLADSDAPALTSTGARLLSPAYAAPEQILGETISTATDVYSLGVLLYELLTGRLPHPQRGSALHATLEALARETTERPSTALRREAAEVVERAYGRRLAERERFARELAGDLDRIILVALRREPERRYASAALLAEDLRLFLEGRPISARPDTPGYRLRTFLRRHRISAVAAGLVLLSLLGGFGVALWQADVARDSARRAEQHARKAEQVKNFVVSLLEASNPERVSDGAQMSALELIRHAAERVENELGEAPESQAELRVAIGESLSSLGDVDAGIQLVEAGVEQLRVLAASQTKLAHGLHRLAMQYEVVGKLEAAEQAMQEALQLQESAAQRDPLAVISLRTTLAKLAGLRGDLAAMEDMHRRNLDERRALLGPDDARLAVDWNNVAAVALRRDRFAEAEAAYAEAARVIALDPKSPASRMAWLRGGRGYALFGLGRYAEARAEIAAALQIAQNSLHAGHPIVGTMRIGLSLLDREEGQLEQAAVHASEASTLFAAINHPDQALAELQLGLVHLAARRDAEAARVLIDAERHFAARRNREDAQYGLIQVALGLARLRNGEAVGQQQIDQALQAMASRNQDRGVVHADALGLAAAAAGHRQDRGVEREILQQQLQQMTAVLGARHPRTLAIGKRLQGLAAR